MSDTIIPARDLRIGQQWGTGHISLLHELCPRTPGPHVHVVSSSGSSCFPFDAPVDTVARRAVVR